MNNVFCVKFSFRADTSRIFWRGFRKQLRKINPYTVMQECVARVFSGNEASYDTGWSKTAIFFSTFDMYTFGSFIY